MAWTRKGESPFVPPLGRQAHLTAGDYVFTDPAGQPLSQVWLHKRVWLVALERAGLRRRGQYNTRDGFITIALSAGEDPGWVAKVCGTSEEMIFRHYCTWIPDWTPDAGAKVGRILSGGSAGGLRHLPPRRGNSGPTGLPSEIAL